LDGEGKFVAVLRNTGLWLVDLTESTYPARHLGDHASVHQVAVSPDGRWIVTTAWQLGSGVRVWDRASGDFVRDLAPDMGAASAEFSPDGKTLISGTWREFALWEVGSWRQLQRIDRSPDEDWTGPLSFAPNSAWAATTYTRQSIQLLDMETGQQIAVLKPSEPGTVTHLAFNAVGDQLAAVVDDRLQVWKLDDLRSELTNINLALPDDGTMPPNVSFPTPAAIEVRAADDRLE
jgi:WD40 repeat protein